MSDDISFEPVTNIEEAQAVAERLRGVVRRASDGHFQLVRKPSWIAIPRESSAHLSAADKVRLATAFQSRGARWIYAVALEHLQNIVPVYRVGVSEAGLDSFNRECAHFNYALCPSDVASLVICTTDDFLVVVGPPSFARAALGRSESEAWEDFQRVASDPRWTEGMRGMLGSVLRVLRDEYPTFPEGESVRFPRAR